MKSVLPYMACLFSLFHLPCSIFHVAAQSPGGISYQGLARNASGNPLASQTISVQFKIWENQVGGIGTVVYDATHAAVTTNQFGLFNLTIGQGGTLNGGNFSTIAWGSDAHFLEVFVDNVNMGATQFVSVPYAIHAATADSLTNPPSGAFAWNRNNGKVFLNTLTDTVGIGTAFPKSTLDINSPGAGSFMGGYPALMRLHTADDYPFSLVFSNDIAGSAMDYGMWLDNSGGLHFSNDVSGILFSRLSMDSIGRVAIGISSASAMLDVNSNSDNTPFIVRSHSTQSNANPLIRLKKFDDSDLMWIHSDDPSNVFIGAFSGVANNASGGLGIANVFIGEGSGSSNTDGFGNIFLGYYSGNFNSTGSDNTFIGLGAGANNISGSGGVFIGSHAGDASNADNNTFVGASSGQSNVDGNFNTFLGAGSGGSNSNGVRNTFIGNAAGTTNGAGSNNTYLGDQAGVQNEGSGNVFLGWKAGFGETAGSNKLYIANSNANTLIYGDFTAKRTGISTTTPNSTLSVNGSVSAAVRVVSAPTSLTDNDYFVIAVGGAGNTITLPAPNTCSGRMYIIKTGSSLWNTNPPYIDTIGNSTSTLGINSVVRLISDGVNGNWQQW